MRQQGRLTDWNDDKGFGFITPLSGDPTLFAHVSEFPHSQRRPIVTDLVSYVIESDDRGRRHASDVLFLVPTRLRTERTESSAHPLPVPAVAVPPAFLAAAIAVAEIRNA